MGANVSEVQQAAALNFTDIATCKEWVRGLPLTNFAQAQAELLDQLTRLNAVTVPPVERYRMLELLREPAVFVQSELAKKFNNKPLPLAEVERKSFHAVIQLWQVMGDGYRICIQARLELDPAKKDSKDPKDAKDAKDASELIRLTAAICHRAIACAATSMADHMRANHHFPETYWNNLHGLYHLAEQLDVADTGVTDPATRSKNERTCKGAYVAPMLLVLANPQEMFQRHIVMVARWLDHWAEKTVITAAPPEEPAKPPLMIDLASNQGAYRNAEPGAEPRWIDIDGLYQSMKKRVHFLRKGEKTPVELGLGEDCVEPACEALLVLLYQHWCDGREARAHTRRSVASQALGCSGFEAMHYYISGAVFRQPDTRSEVDRYHHREEITTYGSAGAGNAGGGGGKREEEVHSLIHGFIQEQWNVENETVAGLRLTRPPGNPGARLSQLQLMAVLPEDAKSYMLAVARWVIMVGEDLTIGVRLLPGVPEPVGARGTGINARNDKFQQAFLMPAVPALQAPASIVLAPGMFKRDKLLEIHTDKVTKIKLSESLERGFDYERVSYEPA
jgi:cyclic-di-GMP-binding protein